VNTGPSLVDVPEPDPGLPRFLALVTVVTVLAAGAVVLRPAAPPTVARAPLDGPGPAVVPDVSGAGLFLREGCGECHVTAGPSSALGPSLAGVYQRAGRRVAEPTYTGTADSPLGYLWEATLYHCRDLLPGYVCPDLPAVGLRLSLEELEVLVGYLAALDGGGVVP